MNACNDNGSVDTVRKRALRYIYADNNTINYTASLTAAYDRADFAGFKMLAFEPECSDGALISLIERSFREGREEYAQAILNTGRLTEPLLNMNLDLSAYKGNLAGMALWMSLGADVRHDDDRAFASAILGAQTDAITFLKTRGCKLTPEMTDMISRAIQRPDVQNADAVRCQLQALRMQSCAVQQQPALSLV